MSRDSDRAMRRWRRWRARNWSRARAAARTWSSAALLLLAPKDKDESASAILEMRAGTGGEEAALFAGDLLRMYQRYASKPRLEIRD